MGRNLERDAREEQRRRAQLLQKGFELFSKNGIESVSLQSVADAAKVGIATLYNYYQNKISLVSAVSTQMWAGFRDSVLQSCPRAELEAMNAYELISWYADTIISLYQTRPDILRFSGNFKTYISREDPDHAHVNNHLDALKQVDKLFLDAFERAKEDHSIRTDLPGEEIFSLTAMSMLAMAERYAQGIVWTDYSSASHLEELRQVKEMILSWATAK